MNDSLQILSDLVIYNKYSRFLPEQQRRENWDEIVNRNFAMHSDFINKKYSGNTQRELHYATEQAFASVIQKNILPSMRSLQFAGPAIEKENARMYNCGFLPITSIADIADITYLSMCGCGIGFSVQSKHIRHLPPVQERQIGVLTHVIQDSAAGWADAIKTLLSSYLLPGCLKTVTFDSHLIRPEGSPLKTSGGKAPGPKPLLDCIEKIKRIFKNCPPGDKLRPLQVHDIICHISNAVLSGGVRRSALISLFDYDNQDMLYAKTGNWFTYNPQRARCNNSAVLDRKTITKEQFKEIIDITVSGGYGEPGIFWGYQNDNGTNPCAEIGLEPYQFCNLTEINFQAVTEQKHFAQYAREASFLGTLQAAYTDFNYIQDKWKQQTQKSALIGVGITGICSKTIEGDYLDPAARIVRETNVHFAELLGINPAARTTTVKPAGTTSCVLGTSSGIHPWHSEYFIRRVQVNKKTGLYGYLLDNHLELMEAYNDTDALVCLPVQAPINAIKREQIGFNQLMNLVLKYNKEWVKPGQARDKWVNNNVSCTLSYKPEEVSEMIETLWDERYNYTAVSLFPFDNTQYQQAPFESITKEQFAKMSEHVKRIDFSKVKESDDAFSHGLETACMGGQCELI